MTDFNVDFVLVNNSAINGNFILSSEEEELLASFLIDSSDTLSGLFSIDSSVEPINANFIYGTSPNINAIFKIDCSPTKTSELTNDSGFIADADYVHTDNNYTDDEKTKLAGLENYILPTASAIIKGGVKIGEGLSMDGDVLNAQAQPQEQSDFNETNILLPSFIKNKPTNVSAFYNDAGYLTSFTETDPIYTADKINIALKSEIPTALSELSQDSTHRIVTDTEKSTWDSKQDALEFTPENIANKDAVNGYCPLDINKKVPLTNIPDSVLGQLEYMGSWDAASGFYPTPTEKGQYWIANSNGVVGGVDYKIGDWAVYNGISFDKIDNTDAVTSVNGQTGDVILTIPTATSQLTNDSGYTTQSYVDTSIQSAILDSWAGEY